MKKTMMLLLILMCSVTSLYAADGDLLVNGNLGIGSAVDSKFDLYLSKTYTDPVLAMGLYIRPYPIWTGAGGSASKYFVGLDSSPCPIVNLNQTNTGYTYGMRTSTMRNATSAPDLTDSGTLDTLAGVYISYGHYSTNTSAAPVTTNAYGIRINPYSTKGTIDNMYDLYLGIGSSSGGTATHKWGIYQANTAKNTFGGSVGIGTTSLGSGTKTLVFGAGTSPGALAGAAGIYARTESSGKTTIRLIDSDGTDQLSTPHSSEAPDWMYDADDEVPMIVEEIQRYAGFVRYTNQTRQARLTSMTDAEKSALSTLQRTCVFKESFEEHNARLGLGGESALVRLDWDFEQQAMKSARDAEIQAALKARADQGVAVAAARDANVKAELIQQEAPIQIPEEYVIRQMPPRLRAALDASKRQ